MTSTPFRVVRHSRVVSDAYGRHYRIGETAEELTGHPREHQAWRAWLCLAAIGPLQYLFGFAVLGLPGASTWDPVHTMWLLALFVVVQAGTALPCAWLARDRRLSPAPVVAAGGVLAAAGLACLGRADSLATAAIGYAGLGGIGAGLVYSTAASTAARWFPDRRVSTIGFVTGGFAVGAVPGILALTLTSSSDAHMLVYDVLAVVALVVVVAAGRGLVEPPPHWWPEQIDPQLWAIDHSLNRSLPHNVPAVREYPPLDALRTSALPLMWLIFAAISAVALLGTAFVSRYAVDAGLGMTTAGLAAAGLAAVSGLGRSATARLSDLFGRSHVLVVVVVVEGAAQLGLAATGHLGTSIGFLLCAILAGLGGGAFYAIFAHLVLEYFGERNVLQNQAMLYSAKAAGGIVGIGGGALLILHLGDDAAFAIAGVTALVAACLLPLLKQPGRPTLPTRP
ncbi:MULTISPECIES: MFS transporter [unclassified Nocardioides]|uniref:MFS transporter n=1 Tax=unclassified Nocardioides TaxID=2615069 RepID=UPI00361A5EA8